MPSWKLQRDGSGGSGGGGTRRHEAAAVGVCRRRRSSRHGLQQPLHSGLPVKARSPPHPPHPPPPHPSAASAAPRKLAPCLYGRYIFTVRPRRSRRFLCARRAARGGFSWVQLGAGGRPRWVCTCMQWVPPYSLRCGSLQLQHAAHRPAAQPRRQSRPIAPCPARPRPSPRRRQCRRPHPRPRQLSWTDGRRCCGPWECPSGSCACLAAQYGRREGD